MRVPNNPPAARKFPILCYVTDRQGLPHASPWEITSALIRKMETITSAGVDWLQIREKDLSARELSNLAREALRRTMALSAKQPAVTRVLINDRLDIALSEHADGVHLGEQSLPVTEAKQLMESRLQPAPARLPVPAQPAPGPRQAQPAPADFLLGVSCHSLKGVKSAAQAGATYVIFGPIFATPSKTRFGESQGLHRLAEACRSAKIPVLAIGGITVENAAACIAAGAAGIAAIRLFQDAPDPAATIEELRELTA